MNFVGPQLNSFVKSSSNGPDSMKTIYVPFSISEPCVLHGLLLLSARSFAQISGDMSYHVTALAHKTQCISLVNKALGNKKTAISDATIAAVLMLAVEEVSTNFSFTCLLDVFEFSNTYILLVLAGKS